MGDRGNIRVVDEVHPDIYFYTHWSGSQLNDVVRRALRRGIHCWGDDQYLNRIIFSALIEDDVTGETGYGISTYLGDGDNQIVTVDHGKQTVDGVPFATYIQSE